MKKVLVNSETAKLFYLPTMIFSVREGFFQIKIQMSKVKIVDAEKHG